MEGSKRKAKPQKYDPEFRVKVVKTALSKKLSIEEIFKVYGVRASAWCSMKLCILLLDA
jgi:transposase-like protein